MNIPMITYKSMLIMPTPLPPKMQFSHIPTMGARAARGLRLSCSAFTAPQVTSVVMASKVAPAEVAEAHFLAFEVAQVLIHRQACNRGQCHRQLPALGRGAEDLVDTGTGWAVKPGFGCNVSK